MTEYTPSIEPVTGTTEFSTALARLGLGQYEERLRENGFEDWESATAMIESDMEELGFKLGDRRKLQRAIREYNNTNNKTDLAIRTTRRYRRHPRPDSNAPLKPKTGYVVFGEHVRRDPALSRSSFAELAKETGKRWNEISQEERVHIWEAPASDKLQNYKEELEQYKQTNNYKAYQTYLEEFKQGRHNPESILSPENNVPTNPEHGSPSLLPASQAHEELEATDEEGFDLEGQLQSMTSHVRWGMEEVHHTLKALGVSPDLVKFAAFPREHLTTQAVQAFVQGTGSLLCLWDHEEALGLVKSVYHPDKDTTPVYATEVFAMSAVGSYCDGDAHSLLPRKEFLNFFLYMLSLPSHMCDLRRMRLFACLAICRFTDSVESARRLLFSALSIGRQTFTSSSFQTETPEEKVSYWWSVFRSIVFLESWFAFNTSCEPRVISSDLNLYHSPRSHATHGSEILQERVLELGQLAAYVALDLNRASHAKAAQARAYFESLNEWHRTLPPPMQLSRLSLADPFATSGPTKRSLLQLHILFLGLFIEPYRDCLVDLGRFRLDNPPIGSEDLEALKSVEKQCVLAARQSARVASLLQIDNLIRSHCWVSVYTSFTGCAILLFSASQKLLELHAEAVGEELSCDNATARKLYTPLQIIFNDIREVMVSPVYREMREMHTVVRNVALMPLSQDDAIEGVGEVCRTISDTTRRVMDILQQGLNW
ncbi:hypothetical protein P171DRAFT_472109 [Karstenula rhodostoma CBS 690.94]|uniref:HMG box domain-containing protein n=1 Tax=Karstenula rhodostoma CBS 690.94 TaxID=1392251 RepID=A0A9P4PMG0_9PLEO|nr:hypothetical protein P171DRAFT_472109 [Karstenula rhodostoma CBS 690.94]